MAVGHACVLALLAAVAVALPSPASIMADGALANKYFQAHTPDLQCGWERGTYMLGLMEFYKLTKTQEYLTYARNWADHFNWQVCGSDTGGQSNANNQLSGSTYAELYQLDGSRNSTMIADTRKIFDAAIADPSTVADWSWVDAFFMAMNTYSRIGAATGDVAYFDKQFANFNNSALQGPSATEYHFWNFTDHLFYRDDRFLGTETYWGRGNGWAAGALVAALQYSPATHSAVRTYAEMFQQQAMRLKDIQSTDGCWRSSLLNTTGYPTPETTGSSLFTYAIAYGIHSGLLDGPAFMPVLEKAWSCLSTIALQPSGLFGYCQPVGGSPEHNINANTTSDFCVGQFLLATTYTAYVAQSQ